VRPRRAPPSGRDRAARPRPVAGADRARLVECRARAVAIEASQRLRIEIVTDSKPTDIQGSDVAADHLYRIVYEAITNAAGHGGCRQVAVDLPALGSSLAVSVSDDGAGLQSDAASRDGLGLEMMAYRARLIGATFRIEAGEPAGTRVVVVMPLAPNVPCATAGDDSARAELDQQ
jgi:signal transduction histidine kinase